MAPQKPLVLVSGTVQEMASTDAVSAATTLKQNVMNQSGSTMVLGAAVYVSSANGDNPVVSLAQANAEATSSKTLGLLETSIANGGSGNVVQNGFIVGLDTSTATIGDPVWLSPSVAGGLVYGTANKPVAPNHMVFIGKVVRVHANQGTILVNVQNGFEIEELHNVLITSLTDGNDLTYEAASGLWKNKAKPASGIAVSTGTAWGTSLTAPAGTIVGTTDTQTLTNKTINSSSIGATTPSTGAFTTLSASGTTTLSGGTANGVLYLDGSKAVTSGSALTFDGSNLLINTTDVDAGIGAAPAKTQFSFRAASEGFRMSVTGSSYYNASNGNNIYWRASGSSIGSISFTGSSTAYNTSSDYRLKHDITPLQNALAKVAQLKPVTYKWNADDSDGQGFIAHELQAVIPEAVTGEKDAVDDEGNPVYQGIDPSKIVATLTAALQEQQAIIESLTARITTLEGK